MEKLIKAKITMEDHMSFTFMWAHCTPVVSLNIDPDGIIQNKKLGFHSGSANQLESDIITLLEDEKLRKTIGERARKYIEREHDIRTIVKKYLAIFENIQQ